MCIRDSFGIVRASDPTHYVCEEAFSGSNDFLIEVLGPNQWVLASRYTISRTDDGCDFDRVVELTQTPTALASHLTTGHLAATTNDPAAPGRLLWSEDAGRSFAPAPAPGGGDLELTGVEFLSGRELVVSAYDTASKGEGSHWRVEMPSGEATRLPSPGAYPHVLDARDGVIAGVAVDGPALFVFAGGVDGPFARHDVDSWPESVRFGPDGTLWIATSSQGEGLLERGTPTDDGYSWEVVLEGHSTKCLGFQGADLLLCARRAQEGHDLSLVTLGGDAAPALTLEGLRGPVEVCPEGSDVAVMCPEVWPELERVFLPEQDAPGTNGPGASADSGGPLGCSSSPRRAPSGALWLFVAFVALAARRWRAA